MLGYIIVFFVALVTLFLGMYVGLLRYRKKQCRTRQSEIEGGDYTTNKPEESEGTVENEGTEETKNRIEFDEIDVILNKVQERLRVVGKRDSYMEFICEGDGEDEIQRIVRTQRTQESKFKGTKK